MKLLPFDFEETCRYFSHFKGEDKALAYGIVGGTPQYFRQLEHIFQRRLEGQKGVLRCNTAGVFQDTLAEVFQILFGVISVKIKAFYYIYMIAYLHQRINAEI